MIIPFPKGLENFFKSPMTLFLLLINLAVFSVAFQQKAPTEKLLRDEYFIKVQGHLFSQYVLDHKKVYVKRTQQMAELAQKGKTKQLILMGRLAFMDSFFLENAGAYDFVGDEVGIVYWRKNFLKRNYTIATHLSEVFGVKAGDLKAYRFVSYQFFHSSWAHFFGNMIFLVLFGVLLEQIIGGLALFVVYLLSGVIAGLSFLYLSGGGADIPLVGASGSISGFVALYGAIHWRERLRFIYFLFIPKLDYVGYVLLPGWVLCVLWLSADVAGYLGTLQEFGGVAHSAHIGGQLAGLITGLTVYVVRRLYVKKGIEKVSNKKADEPWIIPASQMLKINPK